MTTLQQARAAANDGIARAANHAGSQFIRTATAFIRLYAMKHKEFGGEVVVDAWNEAGFVRPSSDKAWGMAFRLAQKEGAIRRDPTRCVIRKKGHCSPGPLWVSLVYVPVQLELVA